MLAAEISKPDGPTHPLCPSCGVPMWLAEVDHLGRYQVRAHFECKECETKAVIPSPN